MNIQKRVLKNLIQYLSENHLSNIQSHLQSWQQQLETYERKNQLNSVEKHLFAFSWSVQVSSRNIQLQINQRKMCDCVLCDCWWCNCCQGNVGFSQFNCCWGFWLCRPETLPAEGQSCCKICQCTGIGGTCFCNGSVCCAPKWLRDWSALSVKK